MALKNYIDGPQYPEDFKAINHLLPVSDTPWLNQVRKDALARFNKEGLPGPKVEEWRYTNLNILRSGVFGAIPVKSTEESGLSELIEKALLEGINGSVIVFHDGYYSDTLSKIIVEDNINLSDINSYLAKSPEKAKTLFADAIQENGLKSLNTAFMTGGVVLSIDHDSKVSQPIQIIYLTTSASHEKATRYRNFIDMEKNSKAIIIETYIGANDVACWNHILTDIHMNEGSQLEMYQFQTEGNETIHMSECSVQVSKGAIFKHYSLLTGGRLSRSEIKPTFTGSHADVRLCGAFLGRNGNSHDVFTHMKHMVPECVSNQIYRGVLDAGGKSAFQGKVYVAKDAQLTNADQSNKNLLLARDAEANSKPELLIFADDVKCTHGATVGELDQQALFYLKSRGLDDISAKALLVEAFVAEVFEDVDLSSVKSRYLDLAREWLNSEQ